MVSSEALEQLNPSPSSPSPNPLDEEMKFTSPEFYFRLGILLCALIFFIESTGSPLSRPLFVLTASLVLSVLMILTITFQWRRLGDWRLSTVQILLIFSALILSLPVSAIMTPSLSSAAMPDAVQPIIESISQELSRIPGISSLFAFLQGLIIFILYIASMIILILQADTARKSGIIILSTLFLVILLVFYPSVETIVGLLFFFFFFRLQWEAPLLLPRRLRPHLKPIQLDYLRELVREGSLSTGETKIYLNQQPRYFAELLDFQLVEVDTIARDVLPGKRLLHDPSCEVLEKVVKGLRRSLWICAGLLYFILPDLIPFYFDDAIVMLIASGAGLNWIRTLIGQGRSQSTGRSRPQRRN